MLLMSKWLYKQNYFVVSFWGVLSNGDLVAPGLWDIYIELCRSFQSYRAHKAIVSQHKL